MSISAVSSATLYATSSYASAAKTDASATTDSFSQYTQQQTQTAAPANDDQSFSEASPVTFAQAVPPPTLYNSISSVSVSTIRGTTLDVEA